MALSPGESDVVTGLAGLVLVSTFVMMSHKSLAPTIRTYALQSMLVAAIAFLVGLFTREYRIWIIAAVTLGLKGFGIPALLDYITDRIRIKRERESAIGIPTSLLIAGAFVLLAFVATAGLTPEAARLGRLTLAASLAVVLIGLFTMATRVKAITQVLGLLVMENGMFLAALSLTYGMPLIVELGIAFDVLVAAIIVGVLIFSISQTFDTIDTKKLESLAE
ncbi:MAG: hydrogenase [Thermoplasmatota archaeon]